MHETKFRAYVLGKMYEVREMIWSDDGLTIVTDGGWMHLPDSNAHLMQFTGLIVNGKEIFEGDIVQCIGGEIAVVLWTTGPVFEWQDGAVTDDFHSFWDGTHDTAMLEVIGNIHEHPELLP